MADDLRSIARTAARLLDARVASPRWRPQPHQVPPPGDWYGWLLLAGRGAGKTAACTAYVSAHVNGPPCLSGPVPHWVGVIGPTQGDAVRACVEGPAGLRRHDPGARLVSAPGGLVVRWPNGAQAHIYGANAPEDVERLRAAGNTCLVHCEELAAWRYLEGTWDQMRFGLRSGPRPHWVASTTPKPKPLIRKLVEGTVRGVEVTHATLYDNPYLEEHIKAALEETYAGTQLGAQELYGRLLDSDENALWDREMIEESRVPSSSLPDLSRITVGVDPSGGTGEQGIVVCGRSLPFPPDGPLDSSTLPRSLPHGYVLDDQTVRLSPDGWGRRAIQTALDWDADDICVEVNFGGDQAIAVLQTAAEKLGVSIPIRRVRATRGKAVRAQPVAALTAQGRFHLAGTFEELETQLCTWYPEVGWSPDRLDAMVWGAWHTKLVGVSVRGAGSLGGAGAGRRIG